jgi:hypothetical protein
MLIFMMVFVRWIITSYVLTETWLMYSVFTHNIFPSNYKVFRADRAYDNVTRGRGALIAISQSVFCVKHRFDFEFINESVWMEIRFRDGSNLLIGNRYFPPDVKFGIYKVTVITWKTF